MVEDVARFGSLLATDDAGPFELHHNAAGAVEAVYTFMARQSLTCPPTLNLENPAEELAEFDLVPLKAKKREIKAAMSNSFGFGGTNSSLIFKQYKD